MEKLFNALITEEGTANATAIMELLSTCKVSYVERKEIFGTRFRLTVGVNDPDLCGVIYTIDGLIYDNNEMSDCVYTFHNDDYEEYAGEGPIDYESLQACIEEIENF